MTLIAAQVKWSGAKLNLWNEMDSRESGRRRGRQQVQMTLSRSFPVMGSRDIKTEGGNGVKRVFVVILL